MKTHDIICDAEGWTYLVNGVRTAVFPSCFMALNAARHAAERDAQAGIAAALRCQGSDGNLHPVQTRRPIHAGSIALGKASDTVPDLRRAARLGA